MSVVSHQNERGSRQVCHSAPFFKKSKLSLRFHCQPGILPVRELFGAPRTPAIFLTEGCPIEKRSAPIGVVQNGTLRYEDQQQHLTVAVGTFTAHKERAGNGRGDWYWRAYRRKQGRLSRRYLGISTNLTLSCLQEAARDLAARSEGLAPGSAVPRKKQR